jgi:hypothetical protein
MAFDSITCITLKNLACNPDLVTRVYRPFAVSNRNHGGLRFEEDWEVEYKRGINVTREQKAPSTK